MSETLDTTILALDDFSVEERKLMGYPSGVSDALLVIKMDEASDWIEGETQQYFIRRGITDEEHFIRTSNHGLFPETPFVGERANRIFLAHRPVFVDDDNDFTITDPTGDPFTDFSLEKDTGIVNGYFFAGYDSNGFPAPWKISYTAGFYADKTDVPPALKNACKLVLAWQWRVNQALENGDMVPRTIKSALDGFYSYGPVVF